MLDSENCIPFSIKNLEVIILGILEWINCMFICLFLKTLLYFSSTKTDIEFSVIRACSGYALLAFRENAPPLAP